MKILYCLINLKINLIPNDMEKYIYYNEPVWTGRDNFYAFLKIILFIVTLPLLLIYPDFPFPSLKGRYTLSGKIKKIDYGPGNKADEIGTIFLTVDDGREVVIKFYNNLDYHISYMVVSIPYRLNSLSCIKE